MPPSLQIEGSFNVRDLGHYLTNEGRTTRPQFLVRAGNLDKVTDSAQQQLLDFGIKMIVDLRDEWEVRQYPNVFAESPHVKYINLPLIGEQLSEDEAWKAQTTNYTFLHELYIKYLTHCHSQIGHIFATIAESPSPTIFHCYAGKDRTGIIAALLLGAVGVPETIIAEDYAQSSAQITQLVDQWREYAVNHGQDMRQFERDAASEPETILKMLQYLQDYYGSLMNYLHFCGVSNDQIESLRRRFVE